MAAVVPPLAKCHSLSPVLSILRPHLHHSFPSLPISLIAHAPDWSIASFTLHPRILACAYNSSMSTPSRRNSGDFVPDTGPLRSVLQQLLEEINGIPTTPRQSSPPIDVPRFVNCTASVWCGGGNIAQDARTKLRAMDEARQRKTSISNLDFTHDEPAPPPLRRHSTQLALLSYGTGTSVWRSQFSPSKIIQENARGDSSNTSADSVASPKSRSRGTVSPKELVHSPPESLEPISKRQRHNTFGSDWTDEQSQFDSGPITAIRGGDGDDHDSSPSLFRSSTFTERRDSPVDITAARRSSVACVSSFRPLPETASNARIVPSTPIRKSSPSKHVTETPQSEEGTAYTPAWMRPFQLVDDEVSIYKQVHGEEWREAPLCLYCFRENGEFHRLYNDGCEECGRDEELEHHYWEPA